MRLFRFCLVLLVGAPLVFFSLDSVKRLVATHAPIIKAMGKPELKYKIIKHPDKRWIKIKYACPSPIYPGTAKVAKNANYKKYTVCCYWNRAAKIVAHAGDCWVKHD